MTSFICDSSAPWTAALMPTLPSSCCHGAVSRCCGAATGHLFSHKSKCVSNLLTVLCWVPYSVNKSPQGSHQLSSLRTATRPGSQLVTVSWECLDASRAQAHESITCNSKSHCCAMGEGGDYKKSKTLSCLSDPRYWDARLWFS